MRKVRLTGLSQALACTGVAATAFVLGMLVMASSTELSYKLGFEAGLEARSTVALLSNPKAAGQICHSWWFSDKHKLRRGTP